MKIDRLKTLCENGQAVFEGKCHDCGCDVRVTSEKQDDGILVAGGAVYEPTPEKYFLKCDECFDKDDTLRNYQECEVFSRVVGYLRPVKSWNEGKAAEFSIRKTFDVDQALEKIGGENGDSV